MTLKLEEISISIGARPLIARLSLIVQPGEVASIMGPSGSGKSSLLRLLCGDLPKSFVSAGRAILGGQDLLTLPPWQRRLGILFQDDLLFPHLRVGENIAFGLPANLSKGERRAKVEALLAEAELQDFAVRDPAELSGGQRQRVALYRMLAAEPLALLLDEPFSALDRALRQRQRELVFERARQRALPVLLVTHDEEDAKAAGGPLISLE